MCCYLVFRIAGYMKHFTLTSPLCLNGKIICHIPPIAVFNRRATLCQYYDYNVEPHVGSLAVSTDRQLPGD